MERYDPKWAMWVGSGEHFSFGNQVEAARRNWETLVRSAGTASRRRGRRDRRAPRLRRRSEGSGGEDVGRQTGPCWNPCSLGADWTNITCVRKGSPPLKAAGPTPPALLDADVDYTLFWRLLPAAKRSGAHALEALAPAFYARRRRRRRKSGGLGPRAGAARTRREGNGSVNPLFVPREWMLVEAYDEAAERGDKSVIETPQQLFSRPYSDDHDPTLVANTPGARPTALIRRAALATCPDRREPSSEEARRVLTWTWVENGCPSAETRGPHASRRM